MRNEAGQRLTESCQENTLVTANTLFQQHKRRLYTWTSPDGQHRNQTDYILCSQRWRSSIQLTKTRPGADCGSDHEIFIAKFRLKLKKVGKTARPFRYDLNQIPYDYTVEVRNRFKGLDLIDRVPDELWTGLLPSHRYLPDRKGLINTCPHKDLRANVHSSFIGNTPKLGTTQMPINGPQGQPFSVHTRRDVVSNPT